MFNACTIIQFAVEVMSSRSGEQMGFVKRRCDPLMCALSLPSACLHQRGHAKPEKLRTLREGQGDFQVQGGGVSFSGFLGLYGGLVVSSGKHPWGPDVGA